MKKDERLESDEKSNKKEQQKLINVNRVIARDAPHDDDDEDEDERMMRRL